FEALAERIEINLFLLQPCKEFWGYISSPRETEQTLKTHHSDDATALHLEPGNRLLASMGKRGRDFLNLIFRSDNLTPIERFSDPGESTLLSTIQSDILHLQDRGTTECPRQVLSESDDSIQIHSCHSPMREMEVLHDCLLDWFERDPQLSPRDILVLTPDIETYSPFVQAVFGCPESSTHQIPFSLADRNPRKQGQILETLLALLNLSGSRLGVIQILTLLECAPVRQKFSLSENDFSVIRTWVETAGIRWGIDAEHRGEFNVPPFEANSWRQGLDRLLLGYAMSNESQELFGPLLPLDLVEGTATQTLGGFIDFIETLFATTSSLALPRSLSDWEIFLRKICSDFFALTEATEHELKIVGQALRKLRDSGKAADFKTPVDLGVIIEFLNVELCEDVHGVGFLDGGVTFASLTPMRSLPFKIICLVGMSDESFPRRSAQLSFDIMTKMSRAGDRSTRDDDRYLFLETLFSARQKLYLSYEGQSIRDNTSRPPAVLVSELMDYITQGFTLASGENVLEKQIITKHRLQAFNQNYFVGGKLVSYSEENFRASCALSAGPQNAKTFFTGSLETPGDEWRSVTLEQLTSFFCNPAEYILTQRLRIRLPRDEDEIEETEPFTLDAREGYGIKQELVEAALSGAGFKRERDLLAAAGRLPVGEIGQTIYGGFCAEVSEFLSVLQPYCPKDKLAPLNFDFVVGKFRLSGRLDTLTRLGLLQYRCTKLKPVDLLRLWIPHLIVNKLGTEAGCISRAVHVASDETFSLGPVADAEKILAQLLEFYWAGLHSPLKFFPQSSFAFAEAQQRRVAGNARIEPLNEALKKWNDVIIRDGAGFRIVPGEKSQSYIGLCFRDLDPLDGDFVQMAQDIFGPVLRFQITPT
ncbi:MAG: helicase/exodeoxyribonuclease gamma subunit, partial [Verrucomicrobiales bacterium]|nr:helicase/exodeoxyribonuclease gamma subunit [Verrucomicrobiales bacterium]